jgi:Clp amino terminal domain, pathogenicity island component
MAKAAIMTPWSWLRSWLSQGAVTEFTMHERFTDRARKVMQLANQEAQRFNHEYVGTEHILLGLIKEGSGVAANALKNLDIDLRKIRQEVVKIVLPGPEGMTTGKLPQTPRAKKVIEYSIEEARNLNHNYVGTEHLLLGLLREQEGIGAQVLINLGLTSESVRDQVMRIIGQPGAATPRPLPQIRRSAKEYDLYLPLRYPDGVLIEPEKIARVEQRLHDQFGGILRFPQNYEGPWRVDGVPFQGKVIVLRVIAEPGGVVRAFFERLKEDLKNELRQETILIFMRDIEIL